MSVVTLVDWWQLKWTVHPTMKKNMLFHICMILFILWKTQIYVKRDVVDASLTFHLVSLHKIERWLICHLLKIFQGRYNCTWTISCCEMIVFGHWKSQLAFHKLLSLFPHKQWATFARSWFLIDARMQPPGKIATMCSVRLQGKHKPIYHPLSE